ncbi:MAG: deoxyguanosinetriphosphate triphosphohydrolase [Myxococcota bacterium]|nr:deoxyguanosinetriphosphate triphosphohydrolase [Myxococcota bacterium]
MTRPSERPTSEYRDRLSREQDEVRSLAPAATRAIDSRGRLHAEPEPPFRTAFQRDRDRIVHSRAFRRLQYKTQVFVHHEGDHYRNRLTHTLEGAQITRTIARVLGLNEDLAEAIALAHDLGHTPFGHAGERVLAEMLSSDGGFDHNRQCLRVVDLLEQRYAEYPGLNLSDETREGILKHGCHWEHPVQLPELLAQRSLEAQVADAADEIAYLNHDLDDGLRAGILDFDMIRDLSLLGAIVRDVEQRHASAPAPVRRSRIVSGMIDELVTDLVDASRRRIEADGLDSPTAARESSTRAIGLSEEVDGARRELKSFLFDHFYNHAEVLSRTRRAEAVVADLFRIFSEEPARLPDGVRARFGGEGAPRAVADYVAGMTDRFALAEHGKNLGSGAQEGL